MKIVFFSTKPYDREFFARDKSAGAHEFQFFEPRLTEETLPLAKGFPAICVFVNDVLDRPTIEALAKDGLQLIALRCAGLNNVDLDAARDCGVTVVRVPAYSPHAVAEHTVGLMLALNRSLHRAFNRVREGNFALDGLLGFDFRGRTVGVIGTGKIGAVLCRILRGFDCKVLAYDVAENPECVEMGVDYVKEVGEIYAKADIISLHCPLVPATHHLIDSDAIKKMKTGVMLVNTSRGALVDTRATVAGLKNGRIGSLGIDVYEEEADLFFEDLSNSVIRDDVFARLLTFPNVIVTGHQAFFTEDALMQIAATTLGNVTEFEASGDCTNKAEAPKPLPSNA
jgi:D-lactate dehydrogenase